MRRIAAAAATTALCATALSPATAAPAPRAAGDDGPYATRKHPIALGTGGAVASVDPEATRAGIRVLRRGGNAVDAAVATAAVLGVTEPYSAGIGGGGFFLYYDAATEQVHTIDGRETAPLAMPRDAFINPETGEPYPFFPDLVTSGVSVGVPGTPDTWKHALSSWGTIRLAKALRPAIRVARRGFVVDETFRQQTLDNAERFRAIRPTKRLFLPAPEVGSIFRNPDLARTYRRIARQGVRVLYDGAIARQIVEVVQDPPTTRNTNLPVPPGYMKLRDLRRYDVRTPSPTHVHYRRYDVYGMAPPSSGGSTVGEALNILETFELPARYPMGVLHRYLEASAIAFADRNAYIGDPRYVDVPLGQLLSDAFAKERSCLIDFDDAAPKPVPAGVPDGDYVRFCGRGGDRAAGPSAEDTEGLSTTHLTTADRWGNVVSYTLTIEQTGGSGITVPNRGFLLNNELTDFSLVWDRDDPNRIQPGKRPRSSMSPTIVLRRGDPWLALGTPGGSTIITTVLQILVNRIDLDMGLPEAIAAPRGTQRNTTVVVAEQEFIDLYGRRLSRYYGHDLVLSGAPGTSTEHIGAATAIEFWHDGRMLAAAEPVRRGGGDARVVDREAWAVPDRD